MRYAELHCKTNFSFLEGASFADELVQQAGALGLEALAVTDRNSLCGVVRAHAAAKELSLKLIIGAEISTQADRILIYPTDRVAYGKLSRLITTGRRRAEKGECKLTLTDVTEHSAGQIGVMVPPDDIIALRKWIGDSHTTIRDAFGDRLYVALELHCGQNDAEKVALLREFSQRNRIPLVAANDVHYHETRRHFLQDVLVCIREGCAIHEAGGRLFSNAERRLKSGSEMRELLGAFSPQSAEWIERSVEIAARCNFSLDELRYEYPEELVPAGTTPITFLTQLAWDGARKRWPGGIPDKVRTQIEHELRLIEDLHYEPYFLTVWDLVEYARSRNILCQGRGSAANSAVCYCIGITSVDPARTDVLFERFVSRERAEAPDIDVDFEHERREEVMQYVYEKYGRERAGIVAEVISYRPKSAARDVGKALGMSLDRVEQLSSLLDRWGNVDDLDDRLREAGLDPQERMLQQFAELVRQILGFPRHLSQHVGGFVITRGPLCELSPIENATMEDRTVIEWDKDDIDALGILKVDCLALGMLTCIHRCFDLIAKHYGRELTLATIPAEDEKVYDMCCRADTIGVFQIESRAQMSMLPRLLPRCFYDLVIEVSIVRPGPIQGGMVHPYLRRRAGEEAVTFPNDALKSVLGKTMGVPLFQEQVMRLAMVAADFTPGEADQLRRAMGAWRRTGQIEKHRQRLLTGMQKNGYPREYAEKIFEMIQGFGEYGFPESHAASFALLVYASAWIKLYYPAVFCAGLLNSQPMGFYAPAQLVRDAQNHGVEVLPVDVNFSDWDCTLDNGKLRLGFRQIRGLSQQRHVAPILQAREKPFESIADFVRRTGLTKATLSILARADAFGSIHMGRREALWEALALHAELPLFQDIDAEEPDAKLAEMPLAEHVTEDYRSAGLSLKAHPMSLVRAELGRRKIVPCAQLKSIKDGAYVRVAGVVLVRQRPDTASGVIFMTIEDETANANAIIWPKIFEKYHRVARTAPTIVIEGRLQKQGEVIHIVAKRFVDLTELLQVQSQSRDFR
jgi:error-prone DNA polymerase